MADLTPYDLAVMMNAQRGADPMQYGFTNSYGLPPPIQFFGQTLDALGDPRLDMLFPMAAGFRAVGGVAPKLLQAMDKQIARRVASGELSPGQPYVQKGTQMFKAFDEAMTGANLERDPLPQHKDLLK